MLAAEFNSVEHASIVIEAGNSVFALRYRSRPCICTVKYKDMSYSFTVLYI